MKFAQLQREVNRVAAMADTGQSDVYFAERAKITKLIDQFITDTDLVKLTGKQVLTLNYWVYSYHVMKLHHWGMRCEKAIRPV